MLLALMVKQVPEELTSLFKVVLEFIVPQVLISACVL
jgi:hypothetical protein